MSADETPVGRGSLKFAIDQLCELEATIHPTLNVYRWWQPDMALPALWNWMTPGDVEGPRGVSGGEPCDVRGWSRIVVTIAVDPTAVMGGGDMLEVEAYFDFALPKLAAVTYGRNPFGQRLARMAGWQTVADRLGEVSTLNLEIPLEIALDIPTT